MKKIIYCVGVCISMAIVYSCTDSNLQNTKATESKADFSMLHLPQTWTDVPDTGILADSVTIDHLQLQPDTVGSDPEWKIIGKITDSKWYGLVYTYTDAESSELHLTTYTLKDSLLSDIVLIQDRLIGILTSGTFYASINEKFAIQTSERVKSKASETDSTIISDEQTDKKFQIGENGSIAVVSNTSVNHVTQAPTHPEEEQEGVFYEEYHYASEATSDSFVYTIMGQEREKHYYFENKDGEQRNLDFSGIAENNPDTYEFKLDGQKLSAQIETYIQEGDISIPQRIVFTYANGKKQTFTRVE